MLSNVYGLLCCNPAINDKAMLVNILSYTPFSSLVFFALFTVSIIIQNKRKRFIEKTKTTNYVGAKA